MTHDPVAVGGIGSRDVILILSGEQRGMCWDAAEIAAGCVSEWEAFLREHGLLGEAV